MHKIVLFCFKQLNNFIQLIKVLASFFIILIIFCWLENIIGAEWGWLSFIRPAVEGMLNFSSALFSSSINAFGATIDIRYICSIAFLFILLFSLKYINAFIEDVENVYDDAHTAFKKSMEKNFNKKLIKQVEKEETKQSKYMLLIHTKIPQKYINIGKTVDLDEQNKLMNDFIKKKTNLQYSNFDGGFLYTFNDFELLDDVLDYLFKIVESKAPLMYSMCIQIGDDYDLIKKLSVLEMYGKIIIGADTLLRYKFKKSHRYETANVGVFQKEFGTVEVHEFKKISVV